MKYDCIVIGQGVSGFSAAMNLARRQKKVAIVTQSVGASAVSSGAWDYGPIPARGNHSYSELRASTSWRKIYRGLLMGITLEQNGLPLERDRIALPAEIEESTVELQEILGSEINLQFRLGNAFCLPTSFGTWKKTFGAQAIHCALDLEQLEGKRALFVSGKGWRLRPDLIAKKLQVGAKASGVTVSIAPLVLDDFNLGEDCPLPHVATRLSNDKELRVRFRENLHEKLKSNTCDVLLFPPLFLDLSFAADLKQSLAIPMGECLSTVEPVAGFRLCSGIKNALAKAGLVSYRVERVEAKILKGRIDTLSCQLAPHGEPIELLADRFILATGKLFGGGIHLGYQNITETVLRLPLFFQTGKPSVSRRSELPWTEREFEEEQPWAKVGLWLDHDFRPLEETQAPVYENLFACGSIIGGIDWAKEGVGIGFMAYTGRMSGLKAL